MTITTERSLNEVDARALFATLDDVEAPNEIPEFHFRASNTWENGTHSQSTISSFYGPRRDMAYPKETVLESDHPSGLAGDARNGSTPLDYLLHALASYLTADVASVAADRGVELTHVSSEIEGGISLLGANGPSDHSLHHGHRGVSVTIHIFGYADEDTLRDIVEQSRRRSPAYDYLANRTPVSVEVATS